MNSTRTVELQTERNSRQAAESAFWQTGGSSTTRAFILPISQALEDPDYAFLLGVQWHPEFLVFMGRQRSLFRTLVAHARHVMTRDGA